MTYKEKYREDRAMLDLRIKKTRAGYLQEGLGIWSKNGRGWYTREMIEHALALGKSTDARVITSRSEDPDAQKAYYFCGIDPARSDTKKSDDGAIGVLKAVPLIGLRDKEPRAYRVTPCYGYRVIGADATQWSGLIHRKHQSFGFTRLTMDVGGGGLWIQPELRKTEQKVFGQPMVVRPIATLEDEEGMMVMADFILGMFRPRDLQIQKALGDLMKGGMFKQENLIDCAHQEFKEALGGGMIAIPPHWTDLPQEETNLWSIEKKYASDWVSGRKTSGDTAGLPAQLINIYYQTNDDGTTFFTKGSNARVFESKMKKDFAYAFIMAYIGFLSWCRSADDEIMVNDEDQAMCWSN